MSSVFDQDDGCKVIAKSLSSNGRLKRLSMEKNKCSFKGFLRIIECVVAAEEAAPSSIKLCDVPMASILDDPSFRSKVKKHCAKIRRCIAVIHRNRADAEKTAMAISIEPIEDDELKQDDNDRAQSPSAKYTVAHTALSNVDKLAVIMSSSKMPKRRRAEPIEDAAPIKRSNKAPAKVLKSGMDAIIDKGSAVGNAQSAKSRRKKRTRKRIDV